MTYRAITTAATWTSLALAASGCPRAVVPDVVATDASDVSRVEADAAPPTDVTVISTCSELVVTALTATPGRFALGYPGSTLRIEGTHFDEVTRVVVGALEQPFTRDPSGALLTSIPPLLEAGTQTVTVSNDRCMAGLPVTISRLLGVVSGETVELYDLVDLAHQGSLAPGVGAITDAMFSLDGLSVLARGAEPMGALVRIAVGGGAPVTLSATSSGPFALAQGNIEATLGLLVVPGGDRAGVLAFDSLAGTVAPYPTPSTAPRDIAVSLDGFQGLLRDASGALYVGNLPFAPSASWQPMAHWHVDSDTTAMALAQAPHDTELLGAAIVQHGAAAASLFALDTTGGSVGAPTTLPIEALPTLRFASGDTVLMDSRTNELIAVDITDLAGTVWLVPLALGETATGVVRTTSSASIYTVGALVLHATPSGALEGDALHVVDFETEPPAEGFALPVPGARGVLGVAGSARTMVVWTANAVMEFAGTSATAPPGPRVTVPGGVAFVVAQP